MPFDGQNLTETQRNCLELADFIEKQPDEKFDMSDWGKPWCGTPGCIAGYAAALWPEFRHAPHYPGFDVEGAAAKIGDESLEVFGVDRPAGFLSRITKTDAVATLRRFAMTGEVRFSA